MHLNEGSFICKCEKTDQSASSIQRHAKSCRGRRQGGEVAQVARRETAADQVVNVMEPFEAERGLTDFHEDLDFIKINIHWKAAICIICQICVGRKQLLNHCVRRHKKRLSARPEAIVAWVRGSSELPPVEGKAELLRVILGIPVYHGWRCKCCVYYCQSVRIMERHQSEQHQDEILDVVDRAEPCRVQRLYRGLGSKYFGVSDVDDNGENEEMQNVAATMLDEPSTGGTVDIKAIVSDRLPESQLLEYRSRCMIS
ncbi:hypothetical protein INT43_008989 [Umbelopsis isabellina]|uniref:C2H2-type domain-containing protein n=1 Tax=Mortierella isabellina TaxID=91625 RepID=A0A8H7PWK0_MORIS|nr:hypothetical protein INT43_008989 [Umbelopsis isabellina]